MKTILCLLALFFSMKSFSQSKYIFHPEGSFSITVIDAGPYYFTGFQLENGNIYSIIENNYLLYGTIETSREVPGTYAFKVNNLPFFPHSSVGNLLSSLEKYEILDEEGIFMGHIRGDFSRNSVGPFLFFDRENLLFAKAVLDPSHSEITISSPTDRVLVTCSKTFKYPGFTADPDYYWTIQETPSLSFDARYLWPFVALASEVWWRGDNREGYY